MSVVHDEVLESLRDELRVAVDTLNRLYHPVEPVDPDRVKVLEARVAELRAALRDRRRELQGGPAAAGHA